MELETMNALLHSVCNGDWVRLNLESQLSAFANEGEVPTETLFRLLKELEIRRGKLRHFHRGRLHGELAPSTFIHDRVDSCYAELPKNGHGNDPVKASQQQQQLRDHFINNPAAVMSINDVMELLDCNRGVADHHCDMLGRENLIIGVKVMNKVLYSKTSKEGIKG